MAKDGRARTWAFLVYPENAPENWREVLADQKIPAAISPLHDRDTWTVVDEKDNPVHKAGEQKKQHYHVVLYFSTLKSAAQVLNVLKPLNVHYVEPVHDTPAYNRYLCHLDQPMKAQYSTSEVVRLNGAACDMTRVLSAEERREIQIEVTEHVQEYGVTEYAELVFWCLAERPDWLSVVMAQTIYFRGLLASVRAMQAHESRQDRTA